MCTSTPPERPGPDTDDEVARPTDDRVAAALVENHRAFLAFLERRVGDRVVAEDILQAAFTRGLERAGTLRDEEAAVAWFYRSLRNAVVDHHRRSGSRSRALASFAEEVELDDAPDAELARVVCQCVIRLADTLKPDYALALRRIEVDGVPVKQFAEEAGITASNAGVRVFRAREALKKQVARSCGTCAEHGCLDCTCGAGGA
ncbi:MAG: sigma-70 family RNA polymerase sigma factor [Pseudomonadota bacterium]|nr:sigma-70 family RNA polymerase sigma factor [Pseudomonadota bacterium]